VKHVFVMIINEQCSRETITFYTENQVNFWTQIGIS